MSTKRERLVAASMLKHFLNDRVVDQVDPVKFWETELDGRLPRAQFGPIREIAQSIVTAVDRLTEDEDSIRIEDMVEAAVNRTLRRQQSKGQHPSNGGE